MSSDQLRENQAIRIVSTRFHCHAAHKSRILTLKKSRTREIMSLRADSGSSQEVASARRAWFAMRPTNSDIYRWQPRKSFIHIISFRPSWPCHGTERYSQDKARTFRSAESSSACATNNSAEIVNSEDQDFSPRIRANILAVSCL
jgi:hypothetical protein